MKKSGLTFLILFISIFPTLAQQEYMGRKTAEQRTELITKNLAEKLHLSATQTDSVSEVILKLVCRQVRLLQWSIRFQPGIF